MYRGRFFVTFVLVLGTLAYGACSPKKTNVQAELVKEGSEKLREADAVEAQLRRFQILFSPSKEEMAGKSGNSEDMAQSYDWTRLTRVERHLVREKLAKYMTLASRVQEIDTQRGLYIENKDVFLLKVSVALSYQKSLENFERTFGVNFEPKNPKQQPKVANTDA